ncbi:uncharacterized protein CC84DRAFT_1102196 [Paraphaeosphaeria sporulosa]|uniref:Dipeptidase n=1 Tax=Paraphaeosphaeria sporulosa TaxID=1460663 RepID=A0A177BY41_9PLEO|nr:uncharacterized protein CC84DRAFT_1102196 [Paraphaeosphaeria sporulosa]OAG00273.1 hypothetical protein CC84DRAFT_1102196 [Paraphaeosphaeria sporulosa]
MEKHTLAPRDVEQAAPSHPPVAAPTRAGRATTKRVAIAVLVAVFLHVGFFLRHPLSHLVQSPSCHRLLDQLTVEQRAQKILRENPLIDGHNDLLISLRMRYKNLIYGHDFKEKFEHGGFPQHVDLPRLDQGMQGGAFWSAFMPCPPGNGTDFSDEKYAPIVKMTLEALDTYNRLGLAYPKYFTLTPDSYAAEQAFKAGRLISPVIIEGLHQIGNSISTLRLYHRLGVRYATLTWNCHNKYADAALESDENFAARIATPYWNGLSPAGRDLVLEMNRLGMLVDLAHVSTDTMRDVLIGNGTEEWKGSIAPPIFSHSSAYAICPHPRNVPDDILHLVKKRNSIVMVNFSPGFVSCKPGKTPSDLPEFDPENSTLDHVVKHIKHIGELIGYDHVGLGTDYDGIESTPEGLEDVSKFPNLVAELLRQGISEKDVGKIVGRNILRVWKEADEVAAKLQQTATPLEDDIRSPWSSDKDEL